MTPIVPGRRALWHSLSLAALAATSGACGTTAAADRAPESRPAASATPRAPADTTDDVRYYQSRSAALKSEAVDEIARTDFARMRRGRLYAAGPDASGADSLERALTDAFERNDFPAVVDVTGKILGADQAHIRAHMLRAVSLRKLGRSGEADFHRAVALGLIDSILHSGDGRGFQSAFTVYRVKEEYDVLKVLGCAPQSQTLTSAGGRHFDVLDARRVSDGAVVRLYFDVTEVFAEEERSLSGR